MIKKLLKGLARVTPNFIHKVDDYLITRRPLIWSTRLHYVVFFSLVSLPTFALTVLTLPISTSSVYIPIYISYLSIIIGLIALGLWLYSQSQYNIRKSFGKTGHFFQLRYTLIFVSIVFTLVVTALMPSWLASHRAYNFFLGKSAINLVTAIGEQSYYDRYATKMDFIKRFPLTYEIEERIRGQMETYTPSIEDDPTLREKLTRENKKALFDTKSPTAETKTNKEQDIGLHKSGSPYLYVLHNTYLALPGDNRRELENLIKTDTTLKFKEKTYQRYISDASYYGQSKYVDGSGNIYSPESLVDLFFIERLLGKKFGKKYSNLQAIIDGEITLSSSQEALLIRSLSSMIEPPLIYGIISDIEHEEFGYSLLLLCLSVAILIIIVAATTANYFGAKSFFIDTTSTIGVAILMFVITAILDEMTRINEDELFLLVCTSIFVLTLTINILLFKCSKRRPGAGFLWQLTSVSMPSSLFFAVVYFLYEILDLDFGDYFAFYIAFSFLLFSLIFYVPFQLRLMYKLYSLPR